MQPLRALRWILAIPIIVYAIYASKREDDTYERNSGPKEKIRQAAGTAQMWLPGVSARHIPHVRPAQAVALLQEAIDSKADESVKQEARTLRQKFDALPHFLRFAGVIDQFVPEFERLRAAIGEVSIPDGEDDKAIEQAIQPKGLVVIARQHDSRRPRPEDDPLFFDAEMMDALGDSLASTPTDLRTLIVLYFSAMEVGEYEMTGPNGETAPPGPFGRFSAPRFSHLCRALIFDLETGKVIGARRFQETDAEERQITMSATGLEVEEGGYPQLREAVRNWIRRISSSPH